MTDQLSESEQRLLDHAKQFVIDSNTLRHNHGGIDTLYSSLITESGQIYDGACFESTMSQANVCGERHAIANMIMGGSYKAKIKHIVVADPVPEVQDKSTPPCGTCRHLIWEFATEDATVLLVQYIQRKDGWIFPKLEKHFIRDLYPYPFDPKPNLWD